MLAMWCIGLALVLRVGVLVLVLVLRAGVLLTSLVICLTIEIYKYRVTRMSRQGMA